MSIWSGLVRRWIAGEGLEDALEKAAESNSRGMSCIINYLGEHQNDEETISRNVGVYLELLREIKYRRISSSISVKPSQLHITSRLEHCLRHFRKILSAAKGYGIFVWVDMEESEFTDRTIESYLKLHGKYRNVGMTLQSNLKRSAGDLERISKRRPVVRLVKGAYRESAEIAYQGREEIDRSYIRIMKLLFERCRKFAVATHDPRMVNLAVEMNKEYRRDVEFQFLMGIQDGLKAKLVESGANVGEYIPFGSAWRSYIYRRLKERPSDLGLILTSIVKR